MTTTQWTNGGADSLLSNAANWTNGVPTGQTLDVLMGGATNADCDATGPFGVKSLDTTGYTGLMYSASPNGVDDVVMRGDLILSAGLQSDFVRARWGTLGGSVDLNGFTGTVDLAAYVPADLGVSTVTMLSDASGNTLDFELGNILAMGSHVYTFVGTLGTGFGYFSDASDVTWSAGAKIIVNGTGILEWTDTAGISFPRLDIVSGQFQPSNAQEFAEIVQSGGAIAMFAPAPSNTITVVGDYTGTGGAISGIKLTIGGTGTASHMTITNCDCSGGTALEADGYCTDGGGNTNVNFAEPIIDDGVKTRGFFALGRG